MKTGMNTMTKMVLAAALPAALLLGACSSSNSSDDEDENPSSSSVTTPSSSDSGNGGTSSSDNGNGGTSSSSDGETSSSSVAAAKFTYVTDTVIVDYKTLNQVAYLDFSTSTITHVAYDLWDIAISDKGVIIANSGVWGSGVRILKTEETDITKDFTSSQNSITAIVDTNSSPFTGELSSVGAGSGSVYLIKDGAGNYHKVLFKSFGPMGKYSLEVANGLNATSAAEVSGSIVSGYGYNYFDLSSKTNVTTSLPKADAWDVKFGRALEFMMGTSFSARSAVIFNADKGVEVAVAEGKNIKEVLNVQGVTFSSAPYSIGASWYSFNHEAKDYSVNKTTYVFKTVEGNYAKLQLKTFYGPNQEQFWSLVQFGYQGDGSQTFAE